MYRTVRPTATTPITTHRTMLSCPSLQGTGKREVAGWWGAST
jgi:hypothetical protein